MSNYDELIRLIFGDRQEKANDLASAQSQLQQLAEQSQENPKLKEIADMALRMQEPTEQPQPNPRIQEIADEALKAQKPAPQPVNNLKEIVDEVVPPQSQPPNQPLNPLLMRQINNIITAKKEYNEADATANKMGKEQNTTVDPDVLRNTANAKAVRARELAKAAGYDLEGQYGSDVTLDNALKNFQIQQAHDIGEIGKTKFRETTEQFAERKYLEYIALGYSPSRAQRLAGYDTRGYQSQRAEYWDNAFQVYGRDGNYITPEGLNYLAHIAEDNPQLASNYANGFKLPTNLQDRENTIADELLKHNRALELLKTGGDIDINKINTSIAGNLKAIEATGEQNRATNRDRIGAQKNANVQEYIEKTRAAQEFEKNQPTQAEKLYKEFYSYGIQSGLSEEDAQKFARERVALAALQLGYGNNGKGGKTSGTSGTKGGEKGTSPKDAMEVYSKQVTAIENAIKSIREGLYNQDGSEKDLGQQYKQSQLAQLQQLENDRNKVLSAMQGLTGTGTPTVRFTEDMTDDQILQAFQSLLDMRGGSWIDARNDFESYYLQSGYMPDKLYHRARKLIDQKFKPDHRK